jgi:hypothetical protein
MMGLTPSLQLSPQQVAAVERTTRAITQRQLGAMVVLEVVVLASMV